LTSHGEGSFVVVQNHPLRRQTKEVTQAGLTDRNEGTGEPEGSPAWATKKGAARRSTRKKMAAL